MSDRSTAVPQPHADHAQIAAGKWEGAVAPRTLYYDCYHHRYCTPDSRPTRRALHGWAPYRWLRTARHVAGRVREQQSLRRWQSIGAPAFALPEDAIIMPRKRGVTVIASVAEGQVIKLSSLPGTARLIVNEGMAWQLAQEAGMETHIPEVIDSGATAESTYWIGIQLAPDDYPFWERLRGVWRRWLVREGLPALQRFYEAAGVTEKPTAGLFDELHATHDFSTDEAVSSLLTRARERAGDSTVYYSLTHGDLTPIHIHRTRSDWTLIDWAKLSKRPLWLELFVEYLRYPTSPRYNRPAFWQWLRGDCPAQDLSRTLRKDIDLYLHWINRWQRTYQQPDDLRYQILLRLYRPLRQVCAVESEERTTATSNVSRQQLAYMRQIANALHLQPASN